MDKPSATTASSDYELLDFGEARKLERFGQFLLDRPCPVAEGMPKSFPALWRQAAARYDRTRGDDGIWTMYATLPQRWTATLPINSNNQFSRDPLGSAPNTARITLQIRLLPSGQVGVFPEQRGNWNWIFQQLEKQQSNRNQPLRVLNLFAYTGGSTLAAAAAGAEVVHIDAARSMVDQARQNAKLAALDDRPIRWIVEDAMKFCCREQKRGNRYDAVILDPPSYGHGPKGEPWKIDQYLIPLLRLCGELTADSRTFILLTCHTPGLGPPELSAYLAEGIFGHCGEPPAAGQLFLATSDGRRLPSGVFARWPA